MLEFKKAREENMRQVCRVGRNGKVGEDSKISKVVRVVRRKKENMVLGCRCRFIIRVMRVMTRIR